MLLATSMLVTFLGLRAALWLRPDADFDVAGFNLHHLFTGLIVLTVGGVPLALFRGDSRRLDLSLVVFGVGLAMALDEWVYLIATDGSNSSYLLPVSWWGGVIVVGLAVTYAALLVVVGGRRSSRSDGSPSV